MPTPSSHRTRSPGGGRKFGRFTDLAARLHIPGADEEKASGKARTRRLLSGQKIAADVARALNWHELVLHGPSTTGGASADSSHPSRKHDVAAVRTYHLTPASEVRSARPGSPRRRDRRPARVQTAKNIRRARRQRQS